MRTSLIACAAIGTVLSGCANPFTKLKCDSMAHDAIKYIRAGDTERLGPLLAKPYRAPTLVKELQPQLPHGAIQYVGDDGLFPMPTYRRYYDVLPDVAVDGDHAQARRVIVDYLDGPIRIDELFLDTTQR